MRTAVSLFLVFAACHDSPDGPPGSVRDRLESGATQLVVAGAESTGSITARRRSGSGWVSGAVELTVEQGEIVATADDRGAIAIERIALDLGPIAIPEGVLGYDAQLTGIHLEAARPAGVVTAWTGDDQAHAAAQVELALTWSITIDGKASPLGAPRLPPVPLELAFDGDGATVRVQAHARAPGLFWSWADLLRLEDLDLVLAAATVTATATL